MPQELAGFYYDKEKNRYFPLKGPIPGSSRSINDKKPSKKNTEASNLCRKNGVKLSKMLQSRELGGNVITYNKRKHDFVEEFLKMQVSKPLVWKYQPTKKIGDGALDWVHIDTHRPEGQTETAILIAGGVNGSLSLFEVGKVGQHVNNGVKCIPDRVWPVSEENKPECCEGPGPIWSPPGASLQMSSNISCIKKCSPCAIDDGFNIQWALITTLGSETYGGFVYVLNLDDPIDFDSNTGLSGLMSHVASFGLTIWTADCNPNLSQAVIGTNRGAALVNLETGRASWVFRSKSDVLAQQFDQLGNVVLCGLRNGAIVSVDVREKQEGVSTGLIRHRIPYSSMGGHGPSSSKRWFELKGNKYPSRTIFMPSSICCLLSLQCYDQYFLASSMDGSIKLYDQRMTERGAVQSYEGQVNSHTRLQLGVDRSERFLMAGGEDCKLRLWSIKSGEMLFEEKFSDSVLSTVCGRTSQSTFTLTLSIDYKSLAVHLLLFQDGFVRTLNEGRSHEERVSGHNLSLGTWFGSQDGLFYMS